MLNNLPKILKFLVLTTGCLLLLNCNIDFAESAKDKDQETTKSSAKPSANKNDSPYVKTLAAKNIEPTQKGLNQYFQELHPNDEQQKRAIQLIEQLGTEDSFSAREDAMSKLLVIPTLPSKLLIDASNGKDPEIRWRAALVLKVGKPEATKTLYAAFKTVEQEQVSGTVEEMLRAISLCDAEYLKFAAREAISTVAQESDAKLLTKAIQSKDSDQQLAGVEALSAALGAKSKPQLTSLLKHSNPQVQLSAAKSLLNLEDRNALQTFVELLSHDELAIRVGAAVALRQASGKYLGYSAYQESKKRKEKIQEWKDWVKTSGQTAKLNLPLKRYGGGDSYLNGNTLLGFGYANKAVEYDPSGKEVWSYTASGIWSAEKLADGNVLIAANTASKVAIVDSSGKEIWTYNTNNPLSAKQLQNGNILIAGYGSTEVMEVDRSKNVVWKHKTQGSCSDAHRLENGNTMVGEYGRGVAEITPDGTTAWEYKGVTGVYGFQPLSNGNVLIADFAGRVVEVTRSKEIIWEVRAPAAVDCFRLPNGNTLITEGNRFVEVTPDKKEIWSQTGCNYGTARR